MSKLLTISIATVTFITGVGLGYIITPQYAMSNTESAAMVGDFGKADKYVDQRFINAMIKHHLGSIDMAKQAQTNSSRDEIKSMANDIITVQQKEVDQLYQWKKDWYNDTSKVKQGEKVNLGSAGDKFDLRFINAMIAHHSDAVMMAQDIQKKSTRDEVLQLADEIITAKSGEIKAMEDWRWAWYNISTTTSMNDGSGMLGTADERFDLRYINEMISHHQGAIALARQVEKTSHRKEIRDLATMIIKEEPKSIEELYAWKKAWYNDTTKVAEPKVANLGSYDEKLDLRFLNALIAHHDAGIMMTKEARLKSARNEVLNNADSTEMFFVTTKKTFEQWRSEWYLTPTSTPAQQM
ncbi:MAG: DUF305 domain-containing protein [Candidatus Dojkabacteria bacterium]|nr:DUF305 domain-containing protein [Candidatus Dojkabacteria bacterium]